MIERGLYYATSDYGRLVKEIGGEWIVSDSTSPRLNAIYWMNCNKVLKWKMMEQLTWQNQKQSNSCLEKTMWEPLFWSVLSFFARCHEYFIFFGTDFAKKKRAEMGFWFPKPALIFYADICMMAKESTPSKTGHSLVAMLNSKWIGVKVVSNQRLHHL